MEKKKYENPELLIIMFTNDDIITTSDFDDWGGDEIPGEEWTD